MAQSSAVPEPASRYSRVKVILAAAAGDAPSDYGCLGAFWEMPLNELIEAKVYGVRLIPPAVASSCCGDGESHSTGSGLVRALRGVPPFDGSRFPPFMWGGSRVAEADIDFIADWIDDGCPADERGRTPLDITTREVMRAKVVDAQFDVSRRRYAYREGEPRQRANLNCLDETERDPLRDAFRAIYDINTFPDDRRSYNNQALIHQNHCQHGWERFLPWHRAYPYEFEQNLQGFARDIMLPYWDWTMPQYRPHDPTNGWVIPEAFQAFLRGSEVEKLLAALDPPPTPAQAKGFRDLVEPRRYFTSQHEFFCYVFKTVGYTAVTPDPMNANRQAMIDALMASNSLWYPLRYPAEYKGCKTINEEIHYHYPTAVTHGTEGFLAEACYRVGRICGGAT